MVHETLADLKDDYKLMSNRYNLVFLPTHSKNILKICKNTTSIEIVLVDLLP
jgi:hypothetical protein